MADLDGGSAASACDEDPGGSPDPGSGGTPSDARYWVGASSTSLSAEHNLGALTTGLVKNTSGTPSTAVAGTDYQAPLADVITAQAYVNPDSITVTAKGIVTAITAGAAKALAATQIAAGTGLTGGGTLATDRTIAVATDGITDTLLRNSAALSVIGRSANSTGDPADIAAGTDGHVLRRSGTTLGFGTLASGAFAGTATNGFVLTLDSGVPTWLAAAGGDHGALTGLSDDDHTIYALLAGRSGGQTLIGGTAASNGLLLQSTSNGTKGLISMGSASTGLIYDETNVRLGIGATGATDPVDGVAAKLAAVSSSNKISWNTNGSFGIVRMAMTDGTRTGYVSVHSSGLLWGTFSAHPAIFRTTDTDRLAILSGGTLDVYATTAPASDPASGHTYAYHDTADGKMKLLDSTGMVTVLN